MSVALAELRRFYQVPLWKKILLAEDFLRATLKPAVRDKSSPLPQIKRILDELNLPASQGGLEHCVEDLGVPESMQQSERLSRNARALVASCAAAAAFENRMSAGSVQDVIHFLWEAQGYLDPEWRLQEPVVSGNWNSVGEFAKLLSPAPAAALYWMAWWRDDQGFLRPEVPFGPLTYPSSRESTGVTHRVAVPIAAYVPSLARGCMYSLQLEAVAGAGATLFEHPESALYPITNEWISTLLLAGGMLNDSVEAMNPEKPGMKHPVCWRINQPSGLEWGFREFEGASHGGAAVRAFWHLANGKYPDDGVVVLAGIEDSLGWQETPWDDPEQNLELVAVGGIAEKVVAAADDEQVDTIVVVKKFVVDNNETGRITNAAQAKKALAGHHRSAAVRIVELD